MSLGPGGRVSGPLHLAIQFPKLAACLAAAGLTVVAWNQVPADQKQRFISYATIELYCKNPAKVLVPDSLKPKLDRTCLCLSTGNVCT